MNEEQLERQWQKYAEKMEMLMAKLPEMEELNALCARIEAAQAAAYVENQMGYHVGLLRAAEQELEALLKKNGFSSAEEVKAFVAGNDPLDKLKSRAAAFSEEYAETLSKLSELDAMLGDEEQ